MKRQHVGTPKENRTCENCEGIILAGQSVCPHCGWRGEPPEDPNQEFIKHTIVCGKCGRIGPGKEFFDPEGGRFVCPRCESGEDELSPLEPCPDGPGKYGYRIQVGATLWQFRSNTHIRELFPGQSKSKLFQVVDSAPSIVYITAIGRKTYAFRANAIDAIEFSE